VQRTPAVGVLATSRRRLSLTAEVVVRLAPLPQAVAVELFTARAQAVAHDFILTDAHANDVREICRRVEGIPLAVELAAARLPMFGLAVLKERLRDRLGPLKANARDAPARHQTLRATIDWSYELLDAPERSLLARLAIFSGGCTLRAAEDVCSDEQITAESIADGLSALVDGSLVALDVERTVARYRLLDATRQYGAERLAPAQRDHLARRHAEWCARFSDDVHRATHELTQTEWAILVLPELDNIDQALDWTREHDLLIHARIAGSLHVLWWRIGKQDEGRRRATDALAHLDEDAHPLVAARLHIARALFSTREKKVAAAQQAIDLLERLGEPPGLLEAYIRLGEGYLTTRDAARLAQVVDRARHLLPRTGEPSLAPMISLLHAGLCSLRGNYLAARDELTRALAERSFAGGEAEFELTYELSSVEYFLGNLERAAQLCDDLVATARERRIAYHEMYALVGSAGFWLLLGEMEHARTAAQRALLAAREINATISAAAIQHLATISARRGDIVRAAKLHGYVDARFVRDDFSFVNVPGACRDLLVTTLDQGLSADEKTRYMRSGKLLSEADAAREALTI
jgi:predicted ATPase